MKSRILITGASGLIGSHFVEQLNENLYDIFVLGRSASKLAPKSTFIEADLSRDWNTSILPQKIDTIVHLAQSENFRDFPDKANDIFYVNTISTLKLADYAFRVGAKHFIFASSAGIYGSGGDGFEEDQDIVYKNDLGFYLGTKHCSEVILENYYTRMNVIMLRFFFVYGKNQRRTMLIPRLVDFVKNEQEISLQGEEGIKINPTHVSDAVSAIFAALQLNGSHKINVAGPEVLSLKEIGLIIGQKVGKNPLFSKVPCVQPNNIVGNISKMSELLLAPATLFSKGVESVI